MTISAARAEDAVQFHAGQRANDTLALRCPNCHASMGSVRYAAPSIFETGQRCSGCSFAILSSQGIWKALCPERQRYYDRFLSEYQIVRAAEGRGSHSADYYLALPYRDLSGHNQDQWTIRSRTYSYIERQILNPIAEGTGSPLLVLDLGAGNAWLSYRLALRRHLPVAVDLSINGRDGLGAAAHYLQSLPALFPRFQAELDRLPFADSQFDCAIFGASFHYSEDYGRTLAEAIRCLRPGGTVIIADSPWYEDDESGQQMLRERRAHFIEHYGFPSDGLASLEYLTDKRLAALESQFGISWSIHRPQYGLRWTMRPLVAKLRRRRQPSQFRVYVAKIKLPQAQAGKTQ